MAATVTPQQQPAQAKDAVRKRRRRTPAGGAADDCFTCAKRNVKCDRKRPYCTQCLEIGNECSGYKTQLTWGVGVASRGKLRGLSLPIAKSPPVNAGSSKKSSSARSRASSSAANSNGWSDSEPPRKSTRDEIDISSDHGSSTPSTPFHGYDYLSMSQPENTPPMHQGNWGGMRFASSLPLGEGPNYRKLGAHLAPIPIVSEPTMSSSLDSVSDVDYMSPLSHSFPRGDDIPYMHSPTLMYDSYTNHSSPIPQSPISTIVIDQRGAPTSCPSLVYAASDQGSSLASQMDSFEAQLSQKLMRECDTLNVPELDIYGSSFNSVWSPENEEASHRSDQNPAQWPSLFEPQSVHVNPDLVAKMPFFTDYYKNIMCPSMVFADGPNNPYRSHILTLASGSRSLQHAICALAACNLRMKRRLSLGQDTRELSEKLMAEKAVADALADAPLDDQSLSEEYQHRNLAVHLLNQQLNDPTKSGHDSVLATVLLLCHYRMAESGIAKFQFDGVKKILTARRAQPQQYDALRESTWMEAILIYFDAISASINEREAQLSPAFHGSPQDTQLLPPGAENLIGCNPRLFQTISRLGRLNILSQNRPVQNAVGSSPPRNIPSRSQSPLVSPLGLALKGGVGGFQQLGGLYTLPVQRFDGNGFCSTLDDDELLSSALCSSAAYDEHRSTFWREWKEARIALQNWEFDSNHLMASLPGQLTGAQIRDLGSLSEAFRYAALLYTERLASPNVASSNSNFQNLVSQVVFFATSIEPGSSAEKFLLWPLFVAGSECVNGFQQTTIRSKCRDIMTQSGYMNNLAAIDVLERLWSGDWKEADPQNPVSKVGIVRRGPFNWTKCTGGNAEVEWIMF